MMGAFSISDFACSNSWSTAEDRDGACKQNEKKNIRKKAEAIFCNLNLFCSHIITEKKKIP